MQASRRREAVRVVLYKRAPIGMCQQETIREALRKRIYHHGIFVQVGSGTLVG
jgi:hypothetical protein